MLFFSCLFNFIYRKAAQKWHPDNFQGDEKKIAEKKFIDIAAAKEVLTDPGKPNFIFNPLNANLNPICHLLAFIRSSPYSAR
jgi:hypothetical protein